MKAKRHNPEMIHVAKARTPEPVWDWLLARLELEHSRLECVELLPEGDVAVEYHERMRNY